MEFLGHRSVELYTLSSAAQKLAWETSIYYLDFYFSCVLVLNSCYICCKERRKKSNYCCRDRTAAQSGKEYLGEFSILWKGRVEKLLNGYLCIIDFNTMVSFLLMIHWKLATLIAYLEKITPYGGILIIWTDS
jgi:hypothetical protein